MKTTTGEVLDAKMTENLIRADDTMIMGDEGYITNGRKRVIQAKGITRAVKDKHKLGRQVLSAS
ncbi:MAG: hypothetical protein P8M25_07055 [Paracoccaceae bacterium]|nr:hypothetical protein [Paracoccaceae bacterium]